MLVPVAFLELLLALVDGSKWTIRAGDERAASIVARLGEVMRLQSVVLPSTGSTLHTEQIRVPAASARLATSLSTSPGTGRTGTVGPARHAAERCVLAVVDDQSRNAPLLVRHASSLSEDSETVVCVLQSATYPDMLTLQLQRLALAIAQGVQAQGGMLLHGALAVWSPPPSTSTGPGQNRKHPSIEFRQAHSKGSGHGVILVGPSTVGKTTASSRLSPPWHSLCDDTTLVVRDAQGTYWAHPWPTWSRFFYGGPGGSWDVQQAVPLKGVFLLEKKTEDGVEALGAGQAIPHLVASVKDASSLMTRHLEAEESRAIHTEWLDNVCALAKAVPAYRLYISVTGAFWLEMERVLGRNSQEVL